MPSAALDMEDNLLLAALPQEERDRWRPWLEEVDLVAGQVLHEARRPARHAWFPVGAVVSLQLWSEDGSCDEVAIVGCDGMIGVSTFMDGGSSPLRAVVQGGGPAFRLSSARGRAEFGGSPAVLRLMLQYMAARDARVAQGVICSRHHTVEQRLCLRLLQGQGCKHGSLLEMTHEQLAGWLGVRRGSVTQEALKLQKAGLIAYARGHITVLDRAGLEQRACECYSLITTEFQRLRASATPMQSSCCLDPWRCVRSHEHADGDVAGV